MQDFIIPFCHQCRSCCTDIPTCLCSYAILEKIQQDHFSIHLIQNFVIYQVEGRDLEKAALLWWHLPDSNILSHMTVPNDQQMYEYLAIPKTRGNCMFWTPEGCKFPDLKPFNCRIFPFHLEKHLFRTASWCPVGQQLNELPTTQQKIQHITEEYMEYCVRFQKEYAWAMQAIKTRFDLQIVHYK